MEALSSEITTLIVNEVDLSDLPSLRLSSHSLSVPATRRLFSRLHVTPTDEDSQGRYRSLLGSELTTQVNMIKLTTSADPYKDQDNYDVEEEADFSEEVELCFRSINRFANLRDVFIEFSDACMVDDPENSWAQDVEESVLYRYEILEALFETLNGQELPMARFRSLNLKNLQNFNDERVVKSPNFAETLSRLSELRLKIVTEYDSSSPENNWSRPQMHTFFVELPSVWLKPAELNLTSLCIHADIFWGYLPLCDLRTIHFPKLKQLEFGNYSFSHRWQLDWILSHKTLEELILDDCNIVNYVYGYGETNSENYPTTPATSWGPVHMWEYDAQWSQYFDAIRIGLPKLRNFKFGSGNWDMGKNFDSEEGFKIGAYEEAYMAFNRGIGPSPWEPVGDFIDALDTLSHGWIIPTQNRLVDARDEDRRAFDDLIEVLKNRL